MKKTYQVLNVLVVFMWFQISKTVVLLNVFVKTMNDALFSGLFEKKVQKKC